MKKFLFVFVVILLYFVIFKIFQVEISIFLKFKYSSIFIGLSFLILILNKWPDIRDVSKKNRNLLAVGFILSILLVLNGLTFFINHENEFRKMVSLISDTYKNIVWSFFNLYGAGGLKPFGIFLCDTT